MPSIYFILWTLRLALSQSSFYVLDDHCTLKFVDAAHEVMVFDSNNYLLNSIKDSESAYLLCLANPSNPELFADSCYTISEFSNCLGSSEILDMNSSIFQYTFVCLFSSHENAFIHSKRIELLQKACYNLPIRLIFIQQEFSHQMYFENLSSDE